MAPAKETAEEQLLRMIEGPAGSRAPSRRVPGRMLSAERLKAWSRGAGEFLRRVVPFRPRRPRRKPRPDAFLRRLQLVNQMFWVVLLALGTYLAVDLVVLRPAPPQLTFSPVPSGLNSDQTEGIDFGGPRSSLEEYQQAMQRRNPFWMADARVVDDSPDSELPYDDLGRLMSALTVVGINRGRVPEALIEDSESRKTHFVTIGDQVNGLTIEDIDLRGVLVTYEGESTYLP